MSSVGHVITKKGKPTPGIWAATLLALSTPAFSAPFTVYSNTPQAGQPLRMTVNRADSSAAASVILSTKDNTALVNVDYDFSSVLVTFAQQQVSATIVIPTHVNATKSGQTLKVGLVVSDGATPVASMLASIVEPTLQWVSAPLADGGYARCKTVGGCHSTTAPCPQGLTPPAVCPYPDIIAKQGDVVSYAWNGVSVDNRVIAALWPIGEYKVAYAGAEGWADEWEGVKPAS